jgi:hypothetical protein
MSVKSIVLKVTKNNRVINNDSVDHFVFDNGVKTNKVTVGRIAAFKDLLETYNGSLIDNRACFAGLNKKLKIHKNKQKVALDIPITIPNNKAIQWLGTLKKRELLPRYFPVYKAVKYKTGIIDMNIHKPNASYVYLTNIRMVYAFPKAVLITLELYDRGVDFDLAYVVGSQFGVTNFNHHFIARFTGFMLQNASTSFDIYMPYMYKLKTFLSVFENLDPKDKHWTGFTCNKTIARIKVPEDISKIGVSITQDNVLSSEVTKAIELINTRVAEDREEFLKEWNKK